MANWKQKTAESIEATQPLIKPSQLIKPPIIKNIKRKREFESLEENRVRFNSQN